MDVLIIGIMMMVVGFILVKQDNYIKTQNIGMWVISAGITITITLLVA